MINSCLSFPFQIESPRGRVAISAPDRSFSHALASDGADVRTVLMMSKHHHFRDSALNTGGKLDEPYNALVVGEKQISSG